MDGTRFDTLTKRLMRTPSRRQVVKGLGGGLVAALGAALATSPAGAGCQGEGAACKKDGQCCSGLCVPPIISTSTARRSVSNVCGAPVVGCAPDNVLACQGKNCGNVVNDCGDTVSCGGPCTAPATCGGGGVSNVCGAPVCKARGVECDISAFEQNCCSNICQADDYNGVPCPGDIPYCCL